MVDEDPIVHPSDVLLAMALGTTALLALLPPWCGLGWGPWFEWLCCATAGLIVALRFVWSR